ncbi:MAG: glycosyltransferase [Chromatiales bacterium]|nr:glycosyltransferase [Chromatiales bacterium]
MSVDYSIIIPAYNEERWLPQTLAALRQAMATTPLDGELIVVDNNSSDATARVASEGGAAVVFEPINQISRARNAGVSVAQGRYLIFVDADTAITPELLQQALYNLQHGCCGGGVLVAFDQKLRLDMRIGLALWNAISRQRRWAAGCFVYALREGFEAVGGFSQKVYASEEIWFSRAMRRWGRKRGMEFSIIEEHTALSSGRKLQWYSSARQLGLLVMCLIMPWFVRFKVLCGFWYKRPNV